MIHKHLFGKATNPEPLAPAWLGRQCIFCSKVSGLDDWQISDMPPEMALCHKSTKRASLWEFFTRSYDCLLKESSNAKR